MNSIVGLLSKEIKDSEALTAIVESVISNESIGDKDGHFYSMLPALKKKYTNPFLDTMFALYENIKANRPNYAADLLELEDIEPGKKTYLIGLVRNIGESAAAPIVADMLNEDAKLSKDANTIFNKCRDFSSGTGSCYKAIMEAISGVTNEDVLFHLYTALSLPEATAQSYIMNNMRAYATHEGIQELINKMGSMNNRKLDHLTGEWYIKDNNVVFNKITPVGESRTGKTFNIAGSVYKEKKDGSIIPYTGSAELSEKLSVFEDFRTLVNPNSGAVLQANIGPVSVELSDKGIKFDGAEVTDIKESLMEYRTMSVSDHVLYTLNKIYENRANVKFLKNTLVVESLTNGHKIELVKRNNMIDMFMFVHDVFEGKFELTISEAAEYLDTNGIKTNFLDAELKIVHEAKSAKEARIKTLQESINAIDKELQKIQEADMDTPELDTVTGALQDQKKDLEIQLSKEQNSETDDIIEKLADKMLFFVNKIKDTIDGGQELEPEYSTDAYMMENGLSVKIVIKGVNIKTYKDINSQVFLSVDSKDGKAEALIDEKTKKDIADVMSKSTVDNFEDWKRSLRIVISNLAVKGVEEPAEPAAAPAAKPEGEEAPAQEEPVAQ